MLDLKRLKAFREVARQGSFSAAADVLNYTQPAVSHHVSRLELEVGARLLERRRSGVVLTEAGRVLLAHAEVLLVRATDAESELAELVNRGQSLVRLGSFATASATIVAEAIASVRRFHPEVELTLIEGDDMLADVKGRTVDIAVVFDDVEHPMPKDEAIELRFLYEDPLLLAMPRRHPLAGKEVVELGDLRDEAWIEGAGTDTPCSLILAAACEEVGFEPQVAFNSGNYQVVQRLVAAGVGVALVPELTIVGADPEVVIRALRPRCPSRRVGIAIRRGYRSAALLAVVAALDRAFESYAAQQPVRRNTSQAVACG